MAAEPLSGTWTGHYECDGTGSMTLALEDHGASAIEGEVHFTTPQGVKGAYRLVGRADPATRELTLAPQRWLERPPNVAALGLKGKPSSNGAAITGQVTGCMAIGQPTFTVERDGGGVRSAVAMAPPPAAPTSGALEGEWEGEFQCRVVQGRITPVPLHLRILQDGDGMAALVSIDASAITALNLGFAKSQRQIVLGYRPAHDRPFVFSRPLALKGAQEGAMFDPVLDVSSETGPMTVRTTYPECTATPRRLGPLTGATAPMPPLVGSWSGVEYRNPVRPGQQPPAPNGADTLVQLVVTAVSPAVYGELRAWFPPNRPISEQDQLAVSIRSIGTTDDGKTILVPLAVRRATGVLARPANWPQAFGNHLYARGAEDLVFFASQPGADQVALQRGKWANLDLHRADDRETAAVAAGEGVPLPLPEGIGGKLRAARSLKEQCTVMQAWAKPFTSIPNVNRTPIQELDREALPRFEDDVFLPTFGLSYITTTEAQRRGVTDLINLCVTRFGMSELRHVSISRPWLAMTSGDEMFAAVSARLMDRHDAKDWASRAPDEINGLPEDQAGLARLAALVKDNSARLKELTAGERAEVQKIIAAKQDNIERGIIRDRAEAVLSGPGRPDTVAQIAALASDIRKSKLRADEQATLIKRAGAKAVGILLPGIEQAAAQAPAIPGSLDGLATATTAALSADAAINSITAELGQQTLRAAARPIFERRRAILMVPEIKTGLQTALMNTPPSGDPEAAVQGLAARWLYPDEFDPRRGGPYAALVSAAIDSAEIRSIRVIDNGTGGNGEPSAQEMAQAVSNTYRGVSSSLNNPDRIWQPGPMQSIMQLFSGVVGPVKIRLAYMEKIGCAPAVFVGQSGYHCDMFIRISTSNAQIAQMLPRVATEAHGRFVRTASGWVFLGGE